MKKLGQCDCTARKTILMYIHYSAAGEIPVFFLWGFSWNHGSLFCSKLLKRYIFLLSSNCIGLEEPHLKSIKAIMSD